MLHTTDGTDSQSWLQGRSVVAGRPASSDYLIKRDGTIIRLVKRGHGSHHAGVCYWQGQKDVKGLVSARLIGIEIENWDSGGEVPTLMQHRAAASLCLVLAQYHQWTPFHAWGHYGLAWPMGRRQDPRGWDWGYMYWLMTFRPESDMLYGADPIV